MSLKDDLKAAIADLERAGVSDFDPDDLDVAPLVSDEPYSSGRWLEYRLAVFVRNIDGTPEYAGVTYARGLTEMQDTDWYELNLHVVDVEPELRQVWTVKRDR